MPKVMIVCPVTERRVPVGLEVEADRAFRRDLPTSGTVRCVACHRRHAWYRAETVLEGTASRQRLERPTPSTQSGIRYTLGPADLAAR